jgi:hypothetical protein
VRDIYHDRRSERVMGLAMAACAVVLLGYAGAVLGASPPNDRGANAFARFVVVLVGGALVATALVIRRRGARPYARLDEEGIVWGVDRRRDLSLPWAAISKIRIAPNPIQLSDDRVFVFQAVRNWRPPAELGWLSRQFIGQNEQQFGTPYVIQSRGTDCPWREFRDVVNGRRPDLSIVEGSFLDPP